MMMRGGLQLMVHHQVVSDFVVVVGNVKSFLVTVLVRLHV